MGTMMMSLVAAESLSVMLNMNYEFHYNRNYTRHLHTQQTNMYFTYLTLIQINNSSLVQHIGYLSGTNLTFPF